MAQSRVYPPAAPGFRMSAADEDAVSVPCRFVRGRNALLAAADFGPVFMDCYLHLGRTQVVLAGGLDEKLKTLLACLALHAATLPRAVTCAWTLHLESAALNIFGVAENPTGRLVGRVLPGRVRPGGGNVLEAEVASAAGRIRRSAVDFAGDDILQAASGYYAHSEQRPARFFELGGDKFAVIAAQPDCDVDWLAAVTLEEVGRLADDAEHAPLETRHYRFDCGCTPERIAAAIKPALGPDLGEIFGEDTHLKVDCPRCGVTHELSPEAFDPSA